MAKRQFHLKEEQIKEIKKYEGQAKRVQELKRLQTVRLYGSGHGVAEIIEMIGCGEGSLRMWAMTYTQMGIEGLLSSYANSAQNARKLSEDQENDLCEKLHQYRPTEVLSSEEYCGTGQFWSPGDVKIVVEKWFDVSYDYMGSYRNLLRRCGFSYQKTEQVYKSRPSEVRIADFEAELEKK